MTTHKNSRSSAHKHLKHHGTILVIEDEEMLQTFLKNLLSNEGFRVLATGNGLEGIELFDRHRGDIQVVFSDLRLPGVDGYTAFLRMKRLDPDVEVIVSSGYVAPHVAAKLRRLGIRYFVDKPYTSDEVLSVIEKAFAEKKEGVLLS